MPKAAKQILTVERICRENSAITTLVLSGDPSPALQARRAGQFMTIRLQEDEGWSKPHPYTMSNAPEDTVVQLTAKALGVFSTRLQSVSAGDRIMVAGPFGRFCKDIEHHHSSIMIAGGIGITPFLSVLRHFGNKGVNHATTLFWANNTPEDFFRLDEMGALTEKIDLKIVLVSVQPWSESNESPDTHGMIRRQGYLTGERFQDHSDPANAKIYLCGSDGMQRFVLGQLTACGVETKSVATESFGTFTFEENRQS